MISLLNLCSNRPLWIDLEVRKFLRTRRRTWVLFNTLKTSVQPNNTSMHYLWECKHTVARRFGFSSTDSCATKCTVCLEQHKQPKCFLTKNKSLFKDKCLIEVERSLICWNLFISHYLLQSHLRIQKLYFRFIHISGFTSQLPVNHIKMRNDQKHFANENKIPPNTHCKNGSWF